MATGYLGVVSQQGLEAIFPERPDVRLFLGRRLYRRTPYRRVCYWAVLPDEIVPQLEFQIEGGETQEAWLTLQSNSLHLGPVFPSEF